MSKIEVGKTYKFFMDRLDDGTITTNINRSAETYYTISIDGSDIFLRDFLKIQNNDAFYFTAKVSKIIEEEIYVDPTTTKFLHYKL